jgi:hypothetical protein
MSMCVIEAEIESDAGTEDSGVCRPSRRGQSPHGGGDPGTPSSRSRAWSGQVASWAPGQGHPDHPDRGRPQGAGLVKKISVDTCVEAFAAQAFSTASLTRLRHAMPLEAARTSKTGCGRRGRLGDEAGREVGPPDGRRSTLRTPRVDRTAAMTSDEASGPDAAGRESPLPALAPVPLMHGIPRS